MIRIMMLSVLLLTFASSPASAKIDRFAQVAKGIYRGDQPDTLEDYQYLKSIGVRTIINLRTERSFIERERSITSKLRIDSRSFPVNSFLGPSEQSMDAILRTLTDPKLQPVFVHCKHGKDRTGLAIGLYRVQFEGWSRNDAWDEMLQFGFSPLLLGLTDYYFDHTD